MKWRETLAYRKQYMYDTDYSGFGESNYRFAPELNLPVISDDQGLSNPVGTIRVIFDSDGETILIFEAGKDFSMGQTDFVAMARLMDMLVPNLAEFWKTQKERHKADKGSCVTV